MSHFDDVAKGWCALILIKGRCENCQKLYTNGFKDKVNNKIVCDKCKKQAIEYGIRFDSDFQESTGAGEEE